MEATMRPKIFLGISICILLTLSLIASYNPAFSRTPKHFSRLQVDEPLNLEIVSIVIDGFPENRVLVRVLDDSGSVITGLTSANFLLWENDISATVSLDTAFQYMAVSLVMDQSGSMNGWQNQVKRACSCFVDSMLPLDRGAIIKFANNAFVDVPMTYNKTALLHSINQYVTTGGTALWDGIALGIQECLPEPTQRAVIAFTDGDDNASTIPYTALPPMTGGEFAIYTIGIGGVVPTGLAYVANNTGGLFIQITNPTQMGLVLEDIHEDMLNQYVLYYHSPLPEPDSTLRTVRVQVSHQGNTDVDSMQYWAPDNYPCQISLPNYFSASLNQSRESGRTLDLFCNITCIAPLSSHLAYYRLTGTNIYNELDLTYLGQNQYVGHIPGDSVSAPGIDFYFIANDFLNFTTLYPAFQAVSMPLSIAVEPNVAPRVIHIPPYAPQEGSPLTLNAYILDETVSIQSASIYYRAGNVQPFTSLPMTHQVGEEYAGTIPGNFTAVSDLEYFLYVLDNQNVASYWPASANPYFVDVVSVPLPVSIVVNMDLLTPSPIPAGGDTLFYTAQVTNITINPVTCDGWVSYYKPNGLDFFHLRLFEDDIIPPDTTLIWNTWEIVSADDPPGSYWMFGQAGDMDDNLVWSFDGYNFTKSSTQIDGNMNIETSSTAILSSFSLSPAFPNPFNSEISIPFTLDHALPIKLRVYNQAGQIITTIVDSYLNAGQYHYIWKANSLSSGIYLITLEVSGRPVQTQKITYMK
jgi:VWFA-related protein